MLPVAWHLSQPGPDISSAALRADLLTKTGHKLLLASMHGTARLDS